MNVCAKFQLPSLSKTGLKVSGGRCSGCSVAYLRQYHKPYLRHYHHLSTFMMVGDERGGGMDRDRVLKYRDLNQAPKDLRDTLYKMHWQYKGNCQ